MKKIRLVLFLISSSIFGQCPPIFGIAIDNECYPLILDIEHIEGAINNPHFYTNSQDNNGILLPFGTSIDNVGTCYLPDGSIESLEYDFDEIDRFKIYVFYKDEEMNCSYETSKSIKIKEPLFFAAKSFSFCPTRNELNIDLTENAPADFGNGTFKWKAIKDYDRVTGESTTIRWGTIINDVLTYDGKLNNFIVYKITPISETGCVGVDFQVFVILNEYPVADQTNFNRTQCSSTPLDLLLDNFVFRFNNNFIWSAKDNPNITGESLTEQTTNKIDDNLVNESNLDQEVIYTITPSNSFCSAPSFNITVTVEKCNTFDENSLLKSVSVFPNPTPNFINIENITTEFKVMIYSKFGEVIFEGNNISKINLEDYPKDLYFLRINTKKDNLSVKILKD